MMPISERFIQIDRKKTSSTFLCSDARPDKEGCFLPNWKTCRDHDVSATISWYSHYTVWSLENCLVERTKGKDSNKLPAFSLQEKAKNAIVVVVTLKYGRSFIFRLPSDSNSLMDIEDASSSFRADLIVVALLDQIFMGRKRSLLRISCLIIIMAATIITIAS